MHHDVTITTACHADAALQRSARAVFWETATTTQFGSPAQRAAFERCYFGYYWDTEPELFLIAREPGGAALGYICAVADTRVHRELYRIARHVPLFDDLYAAYPSHLHINLTATARGRGIGSDLIGTLQRRVSELGSPGLHLVTSPGARNACFYRRNGFVDAVQRDLNDQTRATAVLFLGKTLAQPRA